MRPTFDPHFTVTRVLMPCSATKARTLAGQELPLWQLYRGPLWLTLKARLSRVQFDEGRGVVVLSALYGWCRAGAWREGYDLRLDAKLVSWMRAQGLRGGCDGRVDFQGRGRLVDALSVSEHGKPLEQLIVAGAGLYRELMLAGIDAAKAAGLVAADARVFTVEGGIGEQRSQLGAWVCNVAGAP